MTGIDIFAIFHAPLVLPLLLAIIFASGRFRNESMWALTCVEGFISLVIHLALVLISVGAIGGISLGSLSPIIFDWSELWNLQFSLKIKALNVIFLLATSIIFCVTNLISRSSMEERVGRIYSLLCLKVAIVGAFSTDSLFQFSFFSIASAAPAAFLLGFDDCENTKLVATRHLAVRWVSGFILLFCFLALNVDSVSWIQGEEALRPLLNLGLIPHVVITALMTFALLLQMPLFPFGSYLLGIKDAKRFPIYLPVMTIGNFGVFGLSQFVLPEMRLELLGFQKILLTLGLASLVRSLLSNLMNSSFREKTIRSIQFLSALALIGVGCASEWGLIGVLMTEFSLLTVGAALFGIISICERVARPCSLERLIENRVLSLLFVIGVLSAFGLPFTYSFDGLFLVFRGLGEVLGVAAFWVISFIVPFLVIAVYRMLYQSKSSESEVKNEQFTLNFREKFFCLPMLFLLILFAVYPDAITQLMTGAVGEMLNTVQRVSGV